MMMLRSLILSTQRDALWFQDREIVERTKQKMGGVHGTTLDRPSAKRQKQ